MSHGAVGPQLSALASEAPDVEECVRPGTGVSTVLGVDSLQHHGGRRCVAPAANVPRHLSYSAVKIEVYPY